MRVVVAGGGVAGVAAAGMLSREGHEVVLVDPDPGVPAQPGPDEVFDDWVRPGVGQFHQPHNFLGRGRRVLLDAFPEAHAALMRTGAGEIDMRAFLGDAPAEPGDEDLATVACRRPVFDAALRSAALDGVRCRSGDVGAVVASHGTVEGVSLVDGEQLPADLVVDAAGRGPHAARWLAAAGLEPWPEDTFDCRLLYYSRHFRVRDGEAMPPYASMLGGPRGDLGYLAYAAFIGDNRTYCLCVMASPDEPAWRELRDPGAFLRVAAHLPGLEAWLAVSEPSTGVLPMGALRNTIRHPLDGERVRTPGLVAIGDARSHTNPTFAFGASMSLWHAAELATAVAAAADPEDLTRRFEERIGADTAERYRAVAAEDDQRRRAWSGEPIDLTDRVEAPEMYLRNVVYRTALGDPELVRAVARRINGLDPVDALLQRTDLLDKAQARYDERRADLVPPPPKDQLLAALAG
jgi:2-polyprenyl-6-methoxyphenol hydroxylase-like FAD-dependent oxidoreductase